MESMRTDDRKTWAHGDGVADKSLGGSGREPIIPEELLLDKSYISGTYGPLLRLAMRLFFSRVRPVREQVERIKDIAQQGSVVYVLRSRSNLETLLCHYQARQNGLPVPVMACDAAMTLFQPVGIVLRRIARDFKGRGERRHQGLLKSLVSLGLPVVVYLEDIESFEERFVKEEGDPIAEIIGAQQRMDRAIFLVPQVVVWDRAREHVRPRLDELILGKRVNPSEVRVLINFLRFYRKDSHIFHGDPLDLRTMIDGFTEAEPESLARAVRREVWERIRRERRLVTGPVVRPKQELWERVLNDPRVQQAIERRARKKVRSMEAARREAYRLLKEIAADYDPVFLRFWDWVLTWAIKHLFNGLMVDREGLERIRDAAKRANLVLVPCHKSHMDYMMLGYIFYHNQLYPPLTAAGLNLAFWPMGTLFRKSGAFFIRRDFRGSVLYPAIFSRYVHCLLAEGYPIEFFIEGGRSRSGKMMLPKPGFLSILIDGYRSGACEDIAFVPVAISYERVMEEGAYLREVAGAEKRKESFWELLRSGGVVRRRWGRIWVNFEQPIFLKDFMEGVAPRPGGKARVDLPEILARELVVRINKAVEVVPSALLASAVIGSGIDRATLWDVRRMVQLLMGLLRREGARLSDELRDQGQIDEVVERGMDFFKKENVIREVATEGVDDLANGRAFEIDEGGRKRLDYYKNSIVHFFLPYALCSLATLRGNGLSVPGKDIEDDCSFLERVLRKEFVFEEQRGARERARWGLQGLAQAGLVWNAGERWIVPRSRRRDLLGIARLIQGIVEAYYVVACSLRYLERRRLPEKVFLWRARINGQRMLAEGLISSPEAISYVTFRNVVELLVEEKVIVRRVEGRIMEGVFLSLCSEKPRGLSWKKFKSLVKAYQT